MSLSFGNSASIISSSTSFNNNGDTVIFGVTDPNATLGGVTFNGVSLIQIGSYIHNSFSSRYVSLWALQGAAAGSHTLAISGASSPSGFIVSVTGVQSASPFTGANSSDAGGSTPSVSVTTTVDTAYVVGIGFIRNFSSVITGTTIIGSPADPNTALYRSTSAVSPAGSATLSVNGTGNESTWIAVGVNPITSITLSATAGSLVLTANSATFVRGIGLVASAANLVLTGFYAILKMSQFPQWNNRPKNSVSISNLAKNNGNWNNQQKSQEPI